MSRYRISAALGATLLILIPAVCANGQTGTGSATVTSRTTTGRVATLQQQLEKGLRVRLPAEFEYVERVALLVQQGRLPLKLVQGSFDYARRRDHRRYPFVYFHRVLDARAKRIGITVLPTAPAGR